MPSVVTSPVPADPTDPNKAPVTGITPPAIPGTGIAPAPAPAPAPASTPAPVPTAATPGAATAGVTPYTPPQQDLPALQDTSVASRVAALTSQDSPLMQQARTAGLQQANARGVLNSSIAAGASQNAAISAALPIAQQEASQAQQSNTQRYDLSAQMARLGAQAGFDSQARGENYGYTAALNTQSYAYQAQQQQNANQFQKDMAAIQQGYQVDTANLQATLQSKLQSQANNEQIQRMGVDLANQLQLQQAQSASSLAQIAAQGGVQLQLQTNQFQEAMKELTTSLNEQNSVAMANASVNLFNAEAGLRSALLGNTNLPAAERAAYEQQISALTAPTRDYVSQVLGYVPNSGSTTPPATTATPTPTTGTGIAPIGSSGGNGSLPIAGGVRVS